MGRKEKELESFLESLEPTRDRRHGDVSLAIAMARKSLEMQAQMADSLERIAHVLENSYNDTHKYLNVHD